MAIKFNKEVKSPNIENVTINFDSIRRKELSIEELLIFATENECSDLYIKLFDYPYVSKFGKIFKVPCQPIDKSQWNDFYKFNVSNEYNAQYVGEKILDTSTTIRVP